MNLLKICEIILSKLSAHDFFHCICTVSIFIDVDKNIVTIFSLPLFKIFDSAEKENVIFKHFIIY